LHTYTDLAIRGVVVNMLLVQYVGSVGISAFTAANTLLGLFWAIPNGMLAVSRMLISISVGEEDRKTLVDTKALWQQHSGEDRSGLLRPCLSDL
jgi:Na+-driven multidrug efflux pump